jgi:acyl-CoA-binding protein
MLDAGSTGRRTIVSIQARSNRPPRTCTRWPSAPTTTPCCACTRSTKQGADGDVSGLQGFFDFVGTAKYEAWAKLKGTGQDEAKQKYVDLVKKLVA